MKDKNAPRELKDEVLSVARNFLDSLVFREASQIRGLLRFCGDGMKDVNGADSFSTDQWAQSPRNRFYFGKFGHRYSSR